MGVEIKSFAIEQADCILIEIEESGKYFNLLVDCGITNFQNQIKRELGSRTLNGVVVTHVDQDHIIGIIDLLDKGKKDLIKNKTFILYNKYDESLISYDQGQKLYELIKQHKGQKLLIKSYAGNYFRENEVIKRKKQDTDLPVQLLSKKQRTLVDRKALEKDTVYITMLSPDIAILRKFMRNWSKKKSDSDIQNRSSIVFLLEFNEKSILMLGDAKVIYIEKDLEKIKGLEHIDFIKISHHGALDSNKGLTDIVKKYHCNKTVVTIKENQYKEEKHPSRELIESLERENCRIYTSTKYSCYASDMITRIKIIDKLIV